MRVCQRRNPNESDFLKRHNVSGINPGASVGLHFDWDQKIGPVPLNLVGRIRDRINDGRGVQGDLRLTAGIFAKGPFAAGVFAQGTWANARSNSTF